MIRHAKSHYYHSIRLQELKRLYWAHTVKLLAGSMSQIFIPIYLYKLGYSVAAVMLIILASSVVWGLTQWHLLKFSNWIGMNRAMGIGLILEGLQIWMLATLPNLHWPMWLIVVVWGLAISFYWPQFRACFADSLLHRKVGPAVGLSAALMMFAWGIAPAVGGAIASGFGIYLLYVLAMLLFVAAAFPLFSGPELVRHKPIRWREIPWRRAWRDLVANFGSEVDAVALADVWPLFIFFLVPSYVGVGLLSSVTVIASIVIAFYVGRREVVAGTDGYLRNGVNVVSLTNAVRMFTQSAGQIAGINFFSGLGHALIETPYDSRYYLNAEREPLLPYVYAMMMVSVAADVVLFGFVAAVALLLPAKEALAIGLALAVPAGYAMRLIRAE